MSSSDCNIRGWDLIYKIIENDLQKKEDVLIAFVHLILINSKYRCIGLGDSKTLCGNEKPSEVLPSGWNGDPTTFSLRYINDGKLYLLKGLVADDDIVINLLNVQEVAVSSVAFNVGTTVNALKGDTLKDLIPNYNGVISKILCELITFKSNKEVMTQTCHEQERRSQTSPSRSDPHRSPIPDLAGPPNWPTRVNDPFEYGHSDLDPLGRSRGPGMIFDPMGPRNPPLHPGLGIPGPLPRGAVPPGARFDPMGPPDMDRRPRPRFPPDPDHMPPPGFEDMFM